MKFSMPFHSHPRIPARARALSAIAFAAFVSTLPMERAHAQATSTDAAREALAKKEGDVDSATVLKETLSATDKQYSLLRQGKRALTYDLNYAYIGQQLVNAGFDGTNLTSFSIQNTRGHTVTNTLSADYGYKDNMTLNLTVPIVSKYSQSETSDGLIHGFGDISVGARFQPFPLTRSMPSITVSATARMPTGRSPFEVVDGQGLSTGAGYASGTFGVNLSKVIDPVAIFGSASVTYALPAKNLEQKRNGNTLYEVTPGQTFGFGVGFAYAMSYNITTTLSFQESISGATKLNYINAAGNKVENKTTSQTSAMMNLGLGVRVSPLTTVNFSVGIGLTSDSPDFTFGVNMPLNF
jgi:hypothetical protein